MPPQVVKGSYSFDVRARYTMHEVVGQGAQGIICSAHDSLAEEGATAVAIKKVSNVFEDAMASKRLLREVQLLRHFHHENILRLRVRACALGETAPSALRAAPRLNPPRLGMHACAPRAGPEHRRQGHLHRD